MSNHQSIPKDPVILLSYLNTQLRDFYPTLGELCKSMDLDQETIERSMQGLDYHYDSARNQFI